MKILQVEKAASKGYALGRAHIIKKENLTPDTHLIGPEQIDTEVRKYEAAVKEATVQLNALAISSEIFKAQRKLIHDHTLYDGIVTKIRFEHQNVQLALYNTIQEIYDMFIQMKDDYIRERSADIMDIGNRLMRILKEIKPIQLNDIQEEIVIIAEDLVPSDTYQMNTELVQGFATEQGGITSHVAILARNLELPALVGMKDLLRQVKAGDYIILDGMDGLLFINPDEETIKKYQRLLTEYRKQKKELEDLSSLPATTLDHRTIKVCANASSLDEIKKALKYNIDGIGLFRSESLFMANSYFPSEDEQFAIYKEAAILLGGKEIIIRTLDIGGDKPLPYFTFEHEDNPFLGWRGIRISLELEDIFKTQLRAILRASIYGDVRIMYPMITSLEELIKANRILKQAMTELTAENVAYKKDIKIGMMVETPAAVLCIEDFAEHVDFFSIGTNDLTQYLLAADRGNKKLANIYNSFHPAVIRSIKRVIDIAHEHNLEVGICGELAANDKATCLLMGLGLDVFSMAASETIHIKTKIRNCTYHNSKNLADTAIKADMVDELMSIL